MIKPNLIILADPGTSLMNNAATSSVDSGRPSMTEQRSIIIYSMTAALVLACASLVAFCIIGKSKVNPIDDPLSGPISGEYVGETKTDLISRFGEPSHQWNGHYGSPSLEYARQHVSAITITYKRPNGVLYLSFEKKGDEWVCFRSNWMPNGCVF